MKPLDSLLRDHLALKDLEPRHLQTISGCSSNAVFQAGKLLFREGGDADKFYLIRQGRVALAITSPGKSPITVDTVGEGEFLGWSWLFPPYRWRFDARALEAVHAFAFDGKCLREKCEKDHELGYALMKIFSPLIIERLQAARLQILDVYRKG